MAHRLLRAHWQDLDLPQNFQILDSDDQLRVVKRVMRNLNIDDSRWQPEAGAMVYQRAKDEGLRAAFVPEQLDPTVKRCARFMPVMKDLQ